MDQNNEHQAEVQQEKKQMNGHANGKCQTGTEENNKHVANGNGVHAPAPVAQPVAVAAAAAAPEDNNSLAIVEDANLLPHLESIERLMKLPVVEATWQQSQDVYGKVKGNLHLHVVLVWRRWQSCAAKSSRNYQFTAP